MKIYIASSFRNLHAVQMLRDIFHRDGHTVLDWTRLAPPLPEYLTPEARRAALDADDRGEVFTFCTEACASADLVVYLGQSGQDAACEVGIAYTSGVPVYGLAAPTEKPGTVLARAVTTWFESTYALRQHVNCMAEELAEAPETGFEAGAV